MLQVHGALKKFGEKTALAGAELVLREGEWLGLLGPNGAGKTTLVRAIAGRVKLDAGSIELEGTLGVIPQEIAIYAHMTARENLEVFGSLHGVAKADLEDRVDWALRWTGLADRKSERTSGYSGGMKRRLNIACGILHRPNVILLDEPTVGVDPQSRERIWEMLEELRREGASLLLTTHQLDEAQEVTDRIIIMDHGKTIAAGTFEELLLQTIGAGHLVTLTLKESAPTRLAERGFATEGNQARRTAAHLATDLPLILTEVEAEGASVIDIEIQSPGLQAVFIHLTGRELRE